jgi:hypothetical protein
VSTVVRVLVKAGQARRRARAADVPHPHAAVLRALQTPAFSLDYETPSQMTPNNDICFEAMLCGIGCVPWRE